MDALPSARMLLTREGAAGLAGEVMRREVVEPWRGSPQATQLVDAARLALDWDDEARYVAARSPEGTDDRGRVPPRPQVIFRVGWTTSNDADVSAPLQSDGAVLRVAGHEATVYAQYLTENSLDATIATGTFVTGRVNDRWCYACTSTLPYSLSDNSSTPSLLR